jgi:anti-anti-sigma factor
MAENQEISTRVIGDVSAIDIRGEVTSVTAQPIEAAYLQLSEAGAQKILLVFDAECYINSGGIAILIGILSQSKKKAQSVRMTGLTPHFQKIFSMVGLTRYAQIHASEQIALTDF